MFNIFCLISNVNLSIDEYHHLLYSCTILVVSKFFKTEIPIDERQFLWQRTLCSEPSALKLYQVLKVLLRRTWNEITATKTEFFENGSENALKGLLEEFLD